MQGILNVNKPAGLSSARVVGQVKRLLPRGTKVGHAGTLDPFATGVLLVLIGAATRRCEELMALPKQYDATIKLGAVTATDDLESPEQPFVPAITSGAPPTIDRHAIDALLPRFIGQILQRPPAFSAMKVAGRRAYALARAGKDVVLAQRTVRVDGIAILDFQWPLLSVRIDCGRGTYIRALARDIGAELGVGGYLTALCRTHVGEFTVANSVGIDLLMAQGVERFLA